MTSPSTPPPCPHLTAHRLTSRLLCFLRRCLRVRPLGCPEIDRDAREVPRCSPCPSSSRMYSCLSYATVFCRSHTASHAASASSSGHQIAVDVDRAEFFCATYGDQVYDPDFDHAVVLAQSTVLSPPSTSAFASTTPRKHRHIDYRAWAPDLAGSALVSSTADPTTSASAAEPVGLRRLNNLGNTCFMNFVLLVVFFHPARGGGVLQVWFE